MKKKEKLCCYQQWTLFPLLYILINTCIVKLFNFFPKWLGFCLSVNNI